MNPQNFHEDGYGQPAPYRGNPIPPNPQQMFNFPAVNDMPGNYYGGYLGHDNRNEPIHRNFGEYPQLPAPPPPGPRSSSPFRQPLAPNNEGSDDEEFPQRIANHANASNAPKKRNTAPKPSVKKAAPAKQAKGKQKAEKKATSKEDGTGKRGGRAPGSVNFTTEELTTLVTHILEMTPIGGAGWDELSAEYNKWAKSMGFKQPPEASRASAGPAHQSGFW